MLFPRPCFLALVAAPLFAQDRAPEPAATALPAVVVEGKARSLIGATDTASKGIATQEDFLTRPLLRRGEILETIPGMVITQHAGGGKANQYFLRGFNLDHGTDFAISLDGMPLNFVSHAHGQGYTDLNPVIPELIDSIAYAKGSYTAADGDLSSVGSANFRLVDRLPQHLLKAEIGEYNYHRSLLAGSLTTGEASALTYGLEYNYYDGPWDHAEEFNRWNGLLRWVAGDEDNRFALTFMGYTGSWTSTDQIPADGSGVGRFGTLDPSSGGGSQRYSLNAELVTRDGDVVTRANVYGIHYALDLFSNFTYFTSGLGGDQFEQSESRWVFGGQVARTWEKRELFGVEHDLTLGLQTRHDLIDGIGLWNTRQRSRNGLIRQDDLLQHNAGLYAELQSRWMAKFRTVLGLRGDLHRFENRRSSLAGQEGSDWGGLVSPKFSAIFGPWHETEYYLSFGTGFHSNDTRGVTASRRPADALVRTLGGEIGLRTQALPDLTTTLALFWLRSDSELIYVGDAGTNEPGPGSERYGVELASYWRPCAWFGADAEVALTEARLRGVGADDRVPNSVPVLFSGGVTLGAQGEAPGWFAAARVRAFTGRPLDEAGEFESRDSFLVNASLGYRRQNWEVALDCLNLLNRADNDIEYAYESQLRGELAPVNRVHAHPIEPRMFRARVTLRF
jgi:hypothetical protein